MLIKCFYLKNRRNRLRYLVLLALLNLIICLVHIKDWTPFFSDQVWFYNAAKNSLFHGGFPLVFGMKASITWLHHGAFWLYMLIPALFVTGYHPLTAHFLTVFLGLLNIPLIYYFSGLVFGKKTALISAFLSTFFYYLIILSRLGYHISLVPLMWLVTALSLIKKKYFLSGLFLAFFYQTHLMAVIYWPVAFLYLLFKKAPFSGFIAGSAIGLIPFILTGPVQTFGVVLWMIKYLITAHGISSATNSQLLIFLVPAIILISYALSYLKTRALLLLGVIYIVFNLYYLDSTHYYPPKILYGTNYGRKLEISRNILKKSLISSPGIIVPVGLPGVDNYADPYEYLVWWLERQGNRPGGQYSVFEIDENTNSLTVLE
jgi:hypothetical protein